MPPPAPAGPGPVPADAGPDRAAPRKWRELLRGVALGGGAAAAVVLLARLAPGAMPRLGLAGGEKAALLAALPLLLLLVLALHEVGHLLGGRLAGFRALLLIVGPLRLERSGTGWRAALNRSLALAGGIAASAPTDTRALRSRTLLMVAGGPAASLAAAALALLAARALDPAPGAALVHALLSVLAMANLAIAAATLFPGTTGGFATDGARILRLLRGGPAAERETALLALVGLSMGGVRPREWDAALVQRLLAVRDGSQLDPTARQLAYAHAVDGGRPDQAAEHLEAALAASDLLPESVRPALRLEAAYFLATHRGDAARARALLHGSEGGLLVPEHQRRIAHAAVLLAEDRAPEAAEELARARAEMSRDPSPLDRGDARMQADRLALLERRLAPRRAEQPSGA